MQAPWARLKVNLPLAMGGSKQESRHGTAARGGLGPLPQSPLQARTLQCRAKALRREVKKLIAESDAFIEKLGYNPFSLE
jgi:hypothetical protein